jgi:hypothetical protein
MQPNLIPVQRYHDNQIISFYKLCIWQPCVYIPHSVIIADLRRNLAAILSTFMCTSQLDDNPLVSCYITSLRLLSFYCALISDRPKTDFLVSAENEYSARKCCRIFGQ